MKASSSSIFTITTSCWSGVHTNRTGWSSFEYMVKHVMKLSELHECKLIWYALMKGNWKKSADAMEFRQWMKKNIDLHMHWCFEQRNGCLTKLCMKFVKASAHPSFHVNHIQFTWKGMRKVWSYYELLPLPWVLINFQFSKLMKTTLFWVLAWKCKMTLCISCI